LYLLGDAQQARNGTFRFDRQLEGVDCAPELAAALGEALRACGLPE